MNRSVLAVFLGALVLFVWGGFSHTVLLVGTGFTSLPEEEATLGSLKDSIKQPGLYIFPGKDFRNSTPEQEARWSERFRTGPAGMIIYRPIGGEPFSSKKLIIQSIASLFSASIIVYVMSFMAAHYWERVAVTTFLGFLSCSAASTIYWNWYEFPTSFFVAQIVDQVVGCFLAGLVIAKLVLGRSIAATID